MNALLLKIRRGEGPVFGSLNKLAKAILTANLPQPAVVKPIFRLLYNFHWGIWAVGWRIFTLFWTEPLFRARCVSAGKALRMTSLPHVMGQTQIYVGDNVFIAGKIGIMSGRILDEPKLVIGNNVQIGHLVMITVNKEIVIEDGVCIASETRIADTDGHPRNAEARANLLPPSEDEIKSVRICRKAWIGTGASIQKGVTIGEGAIIGSNSVVVTDVPAYSIAMGNPARVVMKDINVVKAPTESVATR